MLFAGQLEILHFKHFFKKPEHLYEFVKVAGS
jgi:hypothetical protein